jgi:Flp pilus assembly protein TadB
MRRIAVLSDQTKVASVAAVCLMALAVVLKNVLHVPAAALSRDMIVFIIYSGFWLLPSISARREKKSRFETPLFWSLMVLALTLGIIIVYAV